MEKFLCRIEKQNNASTGAPTLFMTEDGFPMTFHLIITDPSLHKQVTDYIYEMGGIVDEDLKNLNSKTILLVESSVYESVRKFVRVPFKPQFVLDSRKSNKLLDLRDYLYDDCVQDTSRAFIDLIFYNVREFKPVNMYPDDLFECTRLSCRDAPFTSGFLSIPSTSESSGSHQKTTKTELNVILKKLASSPQRKTYNFNRKITKKGKENAKKELKSIGTNTDDASTVSSLKTPEKRTSSPVEETPEVSHLSEISSKTPKKRSPVEETPEVSHLSEISSKTPKKRSPVEETPEVSHLSEISSKTPKKRSPVEETPEVSHLSEISSKTPKKHSPVEETPEVSHLSEISSKTPKKRSPVEETPEVSHLSEISSKTPKKRSPVEETPEVSHLSEISSKTEVAQKKIKRSSKSLSSNTDTFVQKLTEDAPTKPNPPSKELISTIREPEHSIPSTSGGPRIETTPSPIAKRRKSSRKVMSYQVIDSSSSESSSPVSVKSSSLFSSTPTSRFKLRRASSKIVSPLLKEIGEASVRRSLRKFKDSPEKPRVVKTVKNTFISSDSSDSDSSVVRRLLRDAQRKQPTVKLSRVSLSNLDSSSEAKSQTIKRTYLPTTALRKNRKTETTPVLKRKDKVRRKSTRVIKPTEKSLKVKAAEKRVKKPTKSDHRTALKTIVKLSPTKKSVKTSPKVLKIKNHHRKK